MRRLLLGPALPNKTIQMWKQTTCGGTGYSSHITITTTIALALELGDHQLVFSDMASAKVMLDSPRPSAGTMIVQGAGSLPGPSRMPRPPVELGWEAEEGVGIPPLRWPASPPKTSPLGVACWPGQIRRARSLLSS